MPEQLTRQKGTAVLQNLLVEDELRIGYYI